MADRHRARTVVVPGPQGTVLGRDGRIHIDSEGDDVWVGGSAVTCIRGSVDL